MIANLNTLLKLKSGPTVPKYRPLVDFIGTPTSLNQNNTVDFTDQSTVDPLGPPITNWAWSFEGGIPATSALQNPTNIDYATPGTYDVTLVATNLDGSGNLTKTDYITVNQFVPPVVTQDFNITNYGINLGQATDNQIYSYGITL